MRRSDRIRSMAARKGLHWELDSTNVWRYVTPHERRCKKEDCLACWYTAERAATGRVVT